MLGKRRGRPVDKTTQYIWDRIDATYGDELFTKSQLFGKTYRHLKGQLDLEHSMKNFAAVKITQALKTRVTITSPMSGRKEKTRRFLALPLGGNEYGWKKLEACNKEELERAESLRGTLAADIGASKAVLMWLVSELAYSDAKTGQVSTVADVFELV